MSVERVMVEKAYKIIKKTKRADVFLEVPLYGRCIDLVYYSKRNLVTVEFKMRNWKKAISQAKDHLLGADYSYICMPKQKLKQYILDEINKAGIGLFYFDDNKKWPFETVVKAKKAVATWKVARNSIVKFINAQQGDN